jgi:hypothetical protein
MVRKKSWRQTKPLRVKSKKRAAFNTAEARKDVMPPERSRKFYSEIELEKGRPRGSEVIEG